MNFLGGIIMALIKTKKPKHHYIEDYMRDLRDEMENMFRSTFEPVFEKEFERGELIYSPPVELCEKDGKYELKTQLPGIKKEDIDVEVTEDYIKIKAETKEEKKEEEENVYRSEFRYGKFMRTIPLPEEVRSEEAEAEFKDGILTISAPKTQKEEKQIKRLTVK